LLAAFYLLVPGITVDRRSNPWKQEDAPDLKLSQHCRARLFMADISLVWSCGLQRGAYVADGLAFLSVWGHCSVSATGRQASGRAGTASRRERSSRLAGQTVALAQGTKGCMRRHGRPAVLTFNSCRRRKLTAC